MSSGETTVVTTDDLREFIASMSLVDGQLVFGQWLVNQELGFGYFNKELVGPGILPDYPEGAVGIRSDDDFWIEAILPWRFHKLSLQEIVGVLWPDVENPIFNPDVETRGK